MWCVPRGVLVVKDVHELWIQVVLGVLVVKLEQKRFDGLAVADPRLEHVGSGPCRVLAPPWPWLECIERAGRTLSHRPQ